MSTPLLLPSPTEFDAIMTHSPGGMYRLMLEDGSWRCDFVSDGYLHMLGCTREDAADFHFDSVFAEQSPEEQQAYSAMMRELAEAPQFRVYDSSFRNREGQRRHLRHTLRSMRGEDGVMRAYGHAYDYTDLREKEQRISQLEELCNTAMDMNDRTVFRYFPRGQRAELTERMAARYGLPVVIRNYPRWADANGQVAPESQSDWFSFFDTIDAGEKVGEAEVIAQLSDGRRARLLMEFSALKDRDGKTLSAIVSSKNITTQYELERSQSADRDSMLLAAREIFPEIIAVNLTKNRYHIIQRAQTTAISAPNEGHYDDLVELRLPHVHPEDQGKFAAASKRGVLLERFGFGEGMIKLVHRRHDKEGFWHWYESALLPQDNLYDDDVLMTIATRNIDAQKEVESQLKQALRIATEELNLSMAQMGKVICNYDIATSTLTVPAAYAAARGIPEVIPNFPECLDTIARVRDKRTLQNLQDAYAAIRAGGKSEGYELYYDDIDGNTGWERMEFAVINDQYGHPVRAVVTLEDVTKARAEHRELQTRAERDGMTGLLNRVTFEGMVRHHLAEDDKGGTLIILDLDDLKSINDSLGHDSGDRAIVAIAGVLASHFRENDLVSRIGGDEFAVFLPGAATNESAVSLAISGLLRRLSTIQIGPSDECVLHCSAGCATSLPGKDSFESLFKRADLALYQVKRAEKNSFAFYAPEMMHADYRFRKSNHILTQDRMRLRRILQLAVSARLEYICVVDVHDGSYSIYTDDGKNTHRIPDSADFGEVTRYIRDHLIDPAERESYYAAANLDRVLSVLSKSGSYSYRYNLADGEREAIFTWYDDGCDELILMVRRTADIDKENDIISEGEVKIH